MAQAYARLPESVKERIDGLRARHSIEASFGAGMPIEARHALHERFPDAEHPVVRTHPETGEKILFVNAFTTHLVNYHTPANVRFGIDYAPGAGDLLRYLISPGHASPNTRCAGAGPPTASPSGTTAPPNTMRCRTTGPPSARWNAPASSATPPTDPSDPLFPLSPSPPRHQL